MLLLEALKFVSTKIKLPVQHFVAIQYGSVFLEIVTIIQVPWMFAIQESCAPNKSSNI